MVYLRNNNLISRHQHGFLAKSSTCTQLLESINDWSIAISNRRLTDVIYFDFSNAFDSVSHSKLIYKLAAYGLAGRLLEVMTAFLANVNVLRYVCYMLSAVRLSSVCRLSVTLVHPTQAVELFGNFFSPYDSPGTLLFWCHKSLVGDAPFPLKFAFKVTHPLSNSEISTNIGS